jgi:hypothetical protein
MIPGTRAFLRRIHAGRVDSRRTGVSRQRLGADDVLDVRRMTQSYWFQEIKRLNKTIALVSQCKKRGHRLRSRKGHCVQCDSSKIAFAGRHDLTQYLYIAGSLQARLIKIGVCKDLRQRIGQICTERHGDAREGKLFMPSKSRGLERSRSGSSAGLAAMRSILTIGRMGLFSNRLSFAAVQ